MLQRQRLINTWTLTNGDSEVQAKGGSRRGVENGLSGAVGFPCDEREAGNETDNEDNENNENDEEEEEEDREGPFVPFQCPGIRNSASVFLFRTCFQSFVSWCVFIL